MSSVLFLVIFSLQMTFFQLEEALQTAQQERDQRLAMKRELDQVKAAEHISSLNDWICELEEVGLLLA